MIIAIDGPAGVGKGTLAKKLAECLGFDYLDTGTLYRSVAFVCLKDNCDLNDEDQTAKAAESLINRYAFKPTEKGYATFIDDENVQDKIRADHVGQASSVVAAQPRVRQALKEFQITFAQNKSAEKGVILDGRDVGTVICPKAEVKLYLTADLKIRAERRVKELQDIGKSVNFDEIYNSMVERDARDSGRDTAPLTMAEDAILLDTTELSVDQVLQKALDVITSKTC